MRLSTKQLACRYIAEWQLRPLNYCLNFPNKYDEKHSRKVTYYCYILFRLDFL